MPKKSLVETSLRSILSNLQVDVIVANVQTVDLDWRRDNYIHNFNRMYYILEGEGRIEVDGTVYYPKPGQLVVLPCNRIQSYSTLGDRPFHKYWCHFTSRVGSRDLFEMYQFPVCLDIADSSKVESWFQNMIDSVQDTSPTAILHRRASMLHLIGFYIEQSMGQTKIPLTSTQKMNQVLQFIEAHLDEKITVEQLAGLVHYHPNYFIRAFRLVFGCSPIQYVNRLRLDQARQKLNSDLPIGDIAQAVGIERHNFSTMFKSYTGFSPRDFRRMLKS